MRNKLLVIILGLVLSACSTTSTNQTPQLSFVSTVGIGIATVRLIEESANQAERAGKVVTVAQAIKNTAASGSPLVVSFLETQARELIDWASLTLSEQVLVNALLFNITDQIEARIDGGTLDKNRLLIFNDVLDTVIRAARPIAEG